VLPTDLGGFASLGALAPMRDPGGM
jgi:hypothetical protein